MDRDAARRDADAGMNANASTAAEPEAVRFCGVDGREGREPEGNNDGEATIHWVLHLDRSRDARDWRPV
jgi:hypothetical protein